MRERIITALMQAMPKKTVSRLMGRIARSPWSRRLIPYYIRRFDVDVSQVEKPVSQYATLLDFFVRGLKEGARPVDPDPRCVVSPVDGTVSQLGSIADDTMLQAKGVTYSLEALLGADAEQARKFCGGQFVTIYLSPRDYHRIHTPVQGRVKRLTYIPGTLFPVNAMGVRCIKGLFARNERLITYMDTPAGYIALVKVGATNVGSIKVQYDPFISTNRPGKRQKENKEYPSMQPMDKGEEIGRFEFGSTVILLFEKGKIDWTDGLAPGRFLHMGQPLAYIRHSSKNDVRLKSDKGE
ncbi:phosphatidylserine decarboxylase proenzyme [Marinithermofilum abyssi]|uniref:Phosphatidylserine decarboxylase proenzyme n=1 Tax=Marinithermofilum abyssi TaxID=1571185 RepID=A0A8J2YCU5_9BACL|nr:archaetidylserine decarboxylase [Marinithermofilum abyssi]GGE18986.1 phosphatidylserine decarboxylase proenzyme [Marinithermofilum abyssi]